MDTGVLSRRWMPAALGLLIACAGLWTACNEHPVEPSNADGIYTYYPPAPPTEPLSVDVLWVIDNSGTMCQEQQLLRDRFGEFVSVFEDKNVDLNIGVTTTHIDTPGYTVEPIARTGRLQAIPQPVPSSFEGCMGDEADPDQTHDGFEPVRAAMRGALACAKEPARWPDPDEVSDDEIACAADSSCTDTHITDLFPSADGGESPYRELPRVLSSADDRYLDDDDHVDLAALERDFACMSFVGTLGHPMERGLQAAVEAVSPEMTGGTVEEPSDTAAPNHKLLRRDAGFALIFLTDENDCTHDGRLPDDSTCLSDVCALANDPGLADSPLVPTEALAEQFMDNLEASKGREISSDEVVVASLHGRNHRYGRDYPDGQPPSPLECTESAIEGFEPDASCESEELGSAFSSDRYERFLLQFEPHRIYPAPDEDKEYLEGLICNPKRFGDYMSEVADIIVGSLGECVTEMPIECDGPSDSSCPDFGFGEGHSQCTRFGNSDQYYCDSAVQVRLFADQRPLDQLRDHDYCIPESVDSPMTPDGCVVDRQLYRFEACDAFDSGVVLEWSEPRWFEQVRGFEIEVVMSGGSLSRR
ncbi:MAG: hypothetical protein ACLFVJ_11355 [Persicimonas sp.]